MSYQKHEIIQSAWWVIYYLEQDGEPRYLLIKRQAKSKKIEWVCPKWKVESWETLEEAAVREVGEETNLQKQFLRVIMKLWLTYIRADNPKIGRMNKDITLFLMHYTWDPSRVVLTTGEGYIGIYKWCTLQEVMALIYYPDLRELIRSSYSLIKKDRPLNPVKKEFLESL